MPAGTFVERMMKEIQEGDVVTITRVPTAFPEPGDDELTDFCVALVRPNEQFGGPEGRLTKTKWVAATALTPGALAKAIEHCSWGITDVVETILAAQK